MCIQKFITKRPGFSVEYRSACPDPVEVFEVETFKWAGNRLEIQIKPEDQDRLNQAIWDVKKIVLEQGDTDVSS